MSLTPPPQALLFDVFGTCVNWRKSVVDALYSQCCAALNTSLPSEVRLRASKMTIEHWGEFAQQWRNLYKAFTRELAEDPTIPFVSVDEHHLKSLRGLLVQWDLEGLFTDDELLSLSLTWHKLEPWADSAPGIAMLNQMSRTCTLSNGNISLLSDLRAFSGIPFSHLFSAEMFESYKPSPKVYLGAAGKLDLDPSQCAMVAAHLNDLEAAKQHGFRVIYVERLGEEDWDEEKVARVKNEGWVDLWIHAGERGFVTVAERLGVV
ncbi:haloacid dehalogenase [Pyrenochaeta sp. DS3sAY3a]|nr:haloacid dehalogenase [Pyrenochaeta sp. DS3sAY3a]